MQIFNVLETPITKSKIMIEASAGTGKTYSIGLLTLRLLLEQDYKINEIVLVTFTNAAAFELKSRTLEVIKDAKRYFENNEDVDPNIKTIVNNNQENISNKLNHAINHINEAMIFTIHGFCSYLLNKYPFDFNIDLNQVLVEDDSEAIIKLINDFFKYELNKFPKDFIELVEPDFKDLNSIIYKIRELSTKPDAIWDNFDFNKDFYKSFLEVSKNLKEKLINKEERLVNITNSFLLNKEENNHLDLNIVKAFVNDYENNIFPYKSLTKEEVLKNRENKERYEEEKYEIYIQKGITNLELDINYNKNGSVSKTKSFIYNDINKYNEFINDYNDVIETVSNYYNVFFNARFYLYNYVIKNLKNERNKLNIKTNDDLIMDVYKAIKNIDKDVFKDLKVLMVDEFQDTDVVQYSIFNEIFNNKIFLMIGDPKQAMYRFRGGDIDTYKRVRNEADVLYTMDTNYRSEQNNIKKVNEYYTKTKGLTKSNLDYYNVNVGQKKLTEPNDNYAPLVYWEYTDGNIRQKQNDGINDLINEIKRLKNEVIIENRSINNSDIAILTNTHNIARMLQNRLKNNNIPAVLLKTQNVFKSSEYKFILILLEAILNYNNERKVNALLTSKYMPSQFDFNTLDNDEIIKEKNQFVEDLFKIYESSYKEGLLKPISIFLDKYNVIGSLSIDNLEGKRAISNFKLLLDVIGEYEKTNNSYSGLLMHLNYLESNQSEVYEERLESDEDAVNILTYHASKGLEYPFVFLFNINASNDNKLDKPYKYHKDGNLHYTFSNVKELEQEELVAEKERIFYVAITRAKYRTYFLHGTHGVSNYFKDAVNIDVLSEIAVKRKIDFRPIKKEKVKEEVKVNIKPFTKKEKIKRSFGYKSYSAITNYLKVDRLLDKVYDEKAFPSSAHIGTIIHQIFEDLDLTNPNLSNINSYFINMDNITLDHIDWLKEVIKTTLNKRFINNEYKLTDILPNNYINELEFMINAKDLNINDLSNFLIEYGITNEVIQLDDINGFLIGLIDVSLNVGNKYYIIDWKTNYIGPDSSYYNLDNLNLEMKQNLYNLQYLIYTLAIYRYLRNINPNFDYNKDFGGIYYLFIRGINEKNNNGIFFDKPDLEVIKRLDKIFGGNNNEL